MADRVEKKRKHDEDDEMDDFLDMMEDSLEDKLSEDEEVPLIATRKRKIHRSR